MSVSTKLALIYAIMAVVEARFGQEQIPVDAVQALGAAGFGEPGVAATIAGSIPSSLLAASSPCDKLSIADSIIDELGNDQQVIDAAIGLVSAETNFNPFAVDVPFVCADPALPVNDVLRGITPLVDPAVTGADVANAASASSVGSPFDAAGLSQAEVMIAQGFTAFTAVGADGNNVVLAGQDGAGAGAGADAGADAGDDAGADAGDDAGADAGNDAGNNAGDVQCGGNQNNNNNNNGQDQNQDNNNGQDQNQDNNNNDQDQNQDNGNQDNGNNNNNNNNGGGAAVDGVDFGACTPTMDFLPGLGGRPQTEFTFIPTDPLVAEGQQEALNPNIITNRICDQLTNVCNANDAAVAACEDAQAQIEALGTRDQTTADTWNSILGF